MCVCVCVCVCVRVCVCGMCVRVSIRAHVCVCSIPWENCVKTTNVPLFTVKARCLTVALLFVAFGGIDTGME